MDIADDEVIAFHLRQNLDPEFEAEPEDVPPIQPPSLKYTLDGLQTAILQWRFKRLNSLLYTAPQPYTHRLP